MARRENIGELEGKKLSLEDISYLFFFFQSKSRKRPSAKEWLSFKFPSTSLTWTVKWITYLIVDLHCNNYLIEQVYIFTIVWNFWKTCKNLLKKPWNEFPRRKELHPKNFTPGEYWMHFASLTKQVLLWMTFYVYESLLFLALCLFIQGIS